MCVYVLPGIEKKTQVPNGYYHQLWATIFRWRMGVCWLGLCPVCRDRLKCLLAKRCRDSAALLCTAALHFSSVVCCLLPASCFRLFLPLLSLLPQDTLQTAAQEVSTALTHSHEIGPSVLRGIAGCLKTIIRQALGKKRKGGGLEINLKDI